MFKFDIKKYFLLIRSYTIPANSAYYFFGVTLAFVLTKTFSLIMLIGLLSFILTYSALYILNDLVDKEYDRTHVLKWRSKRPITTGKITTKPAIITLLIITALGLITAYFINITFFLLTIILNILSFLYSGLKLKERAIPCLILMTLLQLMKILLGWGSVNQTLTNFPLLLSLSSCLSYSYAIGIYKEIKFKSKGYKIFYKSLMIIGLIFYFYDTITITRVTLPLLASIIIFLATWLVYFKAFIKSKKDLTKFSRLGTTVLVPALLSVLIVMLLIF